MLGFSHTPSESQSIKKKEENVENGLFTFPLFASSSRFLLGHPRGVGANGGTVDADVIEVGEVV